MIKVIIFDLGGVLVEFTGIEQLVEISNGQLSKDDARSFWLHSEWLTKFETGQCAENEFAKGVIKELNLKIAPDEFLHEFISWEKGPYPRAIDLLEVLRNSLTLFCLSNNNSLHWKIQKEKSGIHRKFHRCYISYEMGMMKPDQEIYEFVISDSGMLPNEMLYFDDNKECIESASKLGINSYQVHGIDEVKQVLLSQGISFLQNR